MFASCPDDPEMRDSASFWVLDDRGEVGLPRIGIEAVASNWEPHRLQVNVAFPDGRVYRLRDDGTSWPVEGPDGRPTVLGAGPLASAACDRSAPGRMTFDGQAVADLVGDAGRAADTDGPLVDVALRGRSHHGGAAVDPGHAAGRRRSQPQDVHRGRPDGRAALRAAVPRHRLGAGGRTEPSTRSPARGCASAARACASWRGSGATAGSRRCSPAARRSATSPTRRAPTASRSTTRATSSTATATWCPPASSRRPG